MVNKELEKKDLPSWKRVALQTARENIYTGKIGSGNLQELVRFSGALFSDYIKNLGYDGLITFEGGEAEQGDHDTYLIYDPEKVKIIKEQKIKQ